MLNSTISEAFPHAQGYLDSATYGLPSRATAAAMREYLAAWETGDVRPMDLDADVARIRQAFGRIVGAAPVDVALAGSVSQVVGTVAASLPDGAWVLVAEEDFTSVSWPFLADPRLSVTAVPLDQLVDAIQPGVDLVAVSSAQSRDGRVIDLGALADAADRAGAKTLIDGSQSAPWLPIDATRFDVVVAGAYKWLTAPRGIALAAVRPSATWVRPVHANWYAADDPWHHLYGAEVAVSASARRLDTSPAWPLLSATAEALELHASTSTMATYAYCTGLANEFRAGLGLAPSSSAIVSVPGSADALAAAGIRASARGGRVRLAFHVYNDERDVARAVDALRAGVRVAA